MEMDLAGPVLHPSLVGVESFLTLHIKVIPPSFDDWGWGAPFSILSKSLYKIEESVP